MIMIDGVSAQGTTFRPRRALKVVRVVGRTYKVNITAQDILPYEQGGISIGRDVEMNFVVRRSVATFPLPGGATMEMVWIEPGTFIMGSPFANERPQHEVTISRGFWFGRYEITQDG